MAENQVRDAVIVGGGHNGLVCAAYLAAAGLKVTVLERRKVVGGAAVTEEFHPGFRNSVASYTVSLLNPKVIRDLDLPRHGLRVVERKLSNFLPLEDGRYLKVGAGKTAAEVAKFSGRDASRLDAYGERLDAIADVLRDLVLETPPNVTAGSWLTALPELLRGAKLGNRLAKLDIGMRRELLDLFVDSAGDYLNRWFESDPIKAAYGFDGIVGNYASPYPGGSAYVLMHHVFCEVNGKKGAWGHAIGGMGAITQAMAKSAAERGVDIRVASPVREVLVGARPRGRRGDRIESEAIRAQERDLEPEPEAAVRIADRSRGVAPGLPRAHQQLALRLGHVPHERRLVRAARFHRPARTHRRRAPHLRHRWSWRRASPTWTRLTSMPRPADGPSARSSRS